LRKPANPRPAKPIANIAQVDGSGTVPTLAVKVEPMVAPVMVGAFTDVSKTTE